MSDVGKGLFGYSRRGTEGQNRVLADDELGRNAGAEIGQRERGGVGNTRTFLPDRVKEEGQVFGTYTQLLDDRLAGLGIVAYRDQCFCMIIMLRHVDLFDRRNAVECELGTRFNVELGILGRIEDAFHSRVRTCLEFKGAADRKGCAFLHDELAFIGHLLGSRKVTGIHFDETLFTDVRVDIERAGIGNGIRLNAEREHAAGFLAADFKRGTRFRGNQRLIGACADKRKRAVAVDCNKIGLVRKLNLRNTDIAGDGFSNAHHVSGRIDIRGRTDNQTVRLLVRRVKRRVKDDIVVRVQLVDVVRLQIFLAGFNSRRNFRSWSGDERAHKDKLHALEQSVGPACISNVVLAINKRQRTGLETGLRRNSLGIVNIIRIGKCRREDLAGNNRQRTTVDRHVGERAFGVRELVNFDRSAGNGRLAAEPANGILVGQSIGAAVERSRALEAGQVVLFAEDNVFGREGAFALERGDNKRLDRNGTGIVDRISSESISCRQLAFLRNSERSQIKRQSREGSAAIDIDLLKFIGAQFKGAGDVENFSRQRTVLA